MPQLATRKQVAIVPERISGIPDTLALANSANYSIQVQTAEPNISPSFLDTSSARESLTPLKKSIGQETGTAQITFELNGSNDGLNIPAWNSLFLSGGFKQAIVFAIPGVISNGPFRHLEKITQTGTGATAIVVNDAYDGDPELYIQEDSIEGTADASGTWIGESTAAVMTPTAIPAKEGVAYWPISKPISALILDAEATEAFTEGTTFAGETSGARATFLRTDPINNLVIEIEKIRGTFASGETITAIGPDGNYASEEGQAVLTSAPQFPSGGEFFRQFPSTAARLNEDGVAITFAGARTNLSFAFVAGQPVVVTANMQGSIFDVEDSPFILGATKQNRTPPRWQGAAMAIRDGERPGPLGQLSAQTPCLANFSFDMGLQLSQRVCASAPNGIEETFVSDRAPSGSMDPESTLERDIPWIGRLRNGDLSAFRTSLGTEDGNRFTFGFPGFQFTQLSSGDRENLLTRDITFDLTGGNLYNATEGGNVGTSGSDNEVVIIYHTAG